MTQRERAVIRQNFTPGQLEQKKRQAKTRRERQRADREARKAQQANEVGACLIDRATFTAIRAVVEYLDQDGDEREAYERGDDDYIYPSMLVVARWLNKYEPNEAA